MRTESDALFPPGSRDASAQTTGSSLEYVRVRQDWTYFFPANLPDLLFRKNAHAPCTGFLRANQTWTVGTPVEDGSLDLIC